MWPEFRAKADALLVQGGVRETSPHKGRTDRQVLDEVLDGVRLLIRTGHNVSTIAEGGTRSAPPLNDSAVDALVDIWLGSLSAVENTTMQPEEKAQACCEWLLLLSAPILKIVRDQGGQALLKHDRRVEPLYRRLISTRPEGFQYINTSVWGAFLGRGAT